LAKAEGQGCNWGGAVATALSEEIPIMSVL